MHVDHSHQQINFTQFINQELILFSHADNLRVSRLLFAVSVSHFTGLSFSLKSIPSVVDGLKPAQRKVLFSCLKRNLLRDIKVAQLAG